MVTRGQTSFKWGDMADFFWNQSLFDLFLIKGSKMENSEFEINYTL